MKLGDIPFDVSFHFDSELREIPYLRLEIRILNGNSELTNPQEYSSALANYRPSTELPVFPRERPHTKT